MSLYKVEFFYNEYGIFHFFNRTSTPFWCYYDYGNYHNLVKLEKDGYLSETNYNSIAVVSNNMVCFYFDTSYDTSYGNATYYYYLSESGEFKRDKILYYSDRPNTNTVTFSDIPSSGLSQLTVQGNNLSSVSYNNQNYTTFPATLSLDSSATTLNVNGRVSSQRIN